MFTDVSVAKLFWVLTIVESGASGTVALSCCCLDYSWSAHYWCCITLKFTCNPWDQSDSFPLKLTSSLGQRNQLQWKRRKYWCVLVHLWHLNVQGLGNCILLDCCKCLCSKSSIWCWWKKFVASSTPHLIRFFCLNHILWFWNLHTHIGGCCCKIMSMLVLHYHSDRRELLIRRLNFSQIICWPVLE